jgi:hypothetical protein
MAPKILGTVTVKEAERFLEELSNLPDVPDYDDLRRRGLSSNDLQNGRYPAYERMATRNAAVIGQIEMRPTVLVNLIRLRDHLRQAWDAKDRRYRDWYCFCLRRHFHWLTTLMDPMNEHGGRDFDNPPALTPFEATMFYFQTALATKAKHCGGSTCPAPYFIARRKRQQHCSVSCSADVTRASKRRWWANRNDAGGIQ